MITTQQTMFDNKVKPNFLQHEVCNWIKEETKKEKNIEKTLFFRFMPFFLESLGNTFKKEYSFEIKINYTGIEIISTYTKKGTFTALIPLTKSKINDIELNKGDLFITCKDILFDSNDSNEYLAVYIDFIF